MSLLVYYLILISSECTFNKQIVNSTGLEEEAFCLHSRDKLNKLMNKMNK